MKKKVLFIDRDGTLILEPPIDFQVDSLEKLEFYPRVFQNLAKIAKERNCGRLEWSVLDWNTPSIEFYKSLGAKPMDEWTVFRLDKTGIENLAK